MGKDTGRFGKTEMHLVHIRAEKNRVLEKAFHFSDSHLAVCNNRKESEKNKFAIDHAVTCPECLAYLQRHPEDRKKHER